jgi:hypothetical protein
MASFRPQLGFAAALIAFASSLAPMPVAAQFVPQTMELRKIAPDVYTTQERGFWP